MKSGINLLLMTLLTWGCATPQVEVLPMNLEIVEKSPNKWTALTKQNLIQLAQVYDLRPFLFTKKIHIEPRVIPHSHPILTLNTRNAEHPKKLLSTWLHEELHWWLMTKPKEMSLAIIELKKIYPKAPVTMSSGMDSTLLHLVVCHLEMKALAFYLGQKEARTIITEIMKKDKIYPWVYYQILYKDYAIKRIVKRYQLAPTFLN